MMCILILFTVFFITNKYHKRSLKKFSKKHVLLLITVIAITTIDRFYSILIPCRHTMWTSRCRTAPAQLRLTYVGWRQIMGPSVSLLPPHGETVALLTDKRWFRFCDGPRKQVQSLLCSSIVDAATLWGTITVNEWWNDRDVKCCTVPSLLWYNCMCCCGQDWL